MRQLCTISLATKRLDERSLFLKPWLPSVICPLCSHETIVLRTDAAERKRKCTGCGHRFATEERLKDELQRQDEAVKTVLEAAERLKAA